MSHTNKKFTELISECYSKYGNKLLRIIDKKIRNPHISEELLHDLFLKIYKNKKSIDPCKKQTELYLIAAALNLVKDYFRRNSFELNNIIYNDFELLEDEIYPIIDIEQTYIEGEVITTLFDIINQLNQQEKSILWRYYYLHQPISQIAKDLNISEYSTKKILQKIHIYLKKELNNSFK